MENNKKKNMNKKPFEGWKIAVIVLSLIVVIGAIILVLFLFVFNKNNSTTSDESVSSEVSSTSEPPIEKIYVEVYSEIMSQISANLGFGQVIPKTNIFINSNGDKMAVGNPYSQTLNPGGNPFLGIIYIYEKNPVDGVWKKNESLTINFSQTNFFYMGNSISSNDDLSIISIGFYSPPLGLTIYAVFNKSENIYKPFFIFQGFQLNLSISVYSSSNPNNRVVSYSGLVVLPQFNGGFINNTINSNNSITNFFSIENPNLFGPFVGSFFTGGGGPDSNYLAFGFGGNLNEPTSLNLYLKDNSSPGFWNELPQFKNSFTLRDYFSMNQKKLPKNFLAICGKKNNDESKGALIIYNIDDQVTIPFTYLYNRGSVTKTNDNINPVIVGMSSCSFNGDATKIVLGTVTNILQILEFSKSNQTINAIQTIIESSNMKMGISSYFSANSDVFACTYIKVTGSNLNEYGIKIYEKEK